MAMDSVDLEVESLILVQNILTLKDHYYGIYISTVRKLQFHVNANFELHELHHFARAAVM